MTLSEKLRKEIVDLLRRSTKPKINVETSKVMQGAGKGVFARQFIAEKSAVCLYPGVYTPGLPLALSDAVYLGRESLPSQVDPSENDKIVNLQGTTGGYIDGHELVTNNLTQNPLACAHLVNHSRIVNNVEIKSFWWHNVMDRHIDPTYFYLLPNRRRSDGCPWFSHNNEIVTFDCEETPCAGAVFAATRDIEVGEEILLDYGLKDPLPSWAQEWYHSDN
jgi:hypothetical protein